MERLPFRFSAGMPQRRGINPHSGPPNSIEIAEFWDGANVVLTSVRWHLFINSSAALLLLFALALIGSRFRSYLRGNEFAQQVEIARGVQRDLLPSSKCSIERFEIAGDYTPAFGISGDFYDAFSVPGDCAAFVLGDIAGKGVPAAVLTGVLHGAVRSAVGRIRLSIIAPPHAVSMICCSSALPPIALQRCSGLILIRAQGSSGLSMRGTARRC